MTKPSKAQRRPGSPRAGARSPAPAGAEPIPLDPPQAGSDRSLAVKAGAAPPVQTVIYIHGIGNKPVASVLKCQWDTALFGVPMGDRTRMAYWVNREVYPEPAAEDCNAGDRVAAEAASALPFSPLGVRSVGGAAGDAAAVAAAIEALTTDRRQRAVLAKVAANLRAIWPAFPIPTRITRPLVSRIV